MRTYIQNQAAYKMRAAAAAAARFYLACFLYFFFSGAFPICFKEEKIAGRTRTYVQIDRQAQQAYLQEEKEAWYLF